MQVEKSVASVHGVRVDATDLAGAAELVLDRVRSGVGGYICCCNLHLLTVAQTDARVLEALTGASAVFADGWPVAWLARRSGTPAQRVPGPDLMARVLSGSEGTRHFVYGSTLETLESLRAAIEASNPEVNVVGHYAPPVGDAESLDGVEAIRAASPDVVWVGLGAPKQELWMAGNAEALLPAVLVGVGAAFDFLAGSKRRAPRVLRRFGLEWAHRLATEPGRLAGRYVRSAVSLAGLLLLPSRSPRSRR